MPAIQEITEETAKSAEAAKNARPRGWISQGSEKEIEMDTVVPTRDRVRYKN